MFSHKALIRMKTHCTQTSSATRLFEFIQEVCYSHFLLVLVIPPEQGQLSRVQNSWYHFRSFERAGNRNIDFFDRSRKSPERSSHVGAMFRCIRTVQLSRKVSASLIGDLGQA